MNLQVVPNVNFYLSAFDCIITEHIILFIIIAFDLLRIDIYAFKLFCDHFSKYPHHFISPLRISGSAVETLFSQYKHNSGGKLDAVNYPIARGAGSKLLLPITVERIIGMMYFHCQPPFL